MDVLVWFLSALVAAVFVGAGAMKAITPYATLVTNPRMAWAGDFSPTQVRAIGVVEVLGGIGVVLPWAVDVLPVLTPVAASGLVVTMIGAAVVHQRRGERTALPVNAVLGLLALVVAVVRFAQL